METRANYTLIGILVLAGAALIAGFVLWLGSADYRRDFKAYDIVFDGPVSLEEGAAVRYIGIKVGEVDTVRIDRDDPSKVRARIRVARETPIRQDSTASIELAGITGITFVQIGAGTGPELVARPGAPIPVIRSTPTLVNQIVAGGAQALGRANMTFDRINLVLTDDNIAALSRTLNNLEAVTARLAAEDGLVSQAADVLRDVSQASARFEAASAELEAFGRSANLAVTNAGEDFGRAALRVEAAAGAAEQALGEGRQAARAAAELLQGPARATLENTDAVSRDLRILINRVDRMAREIERNPQGFVVGEPVPYEDKRR